MESDKTHCIESKQNAARIRTIIKLMNKIYNDEYSLEYYDLMDKKYGKSEIKFIPIEGGKYYKMEEEFPNQPKELWEQIKEERYQELLKCRNKEQKAHS